jgi:Ca-activated chloride channel family protein
LADSTGGRHYPVEKLDELTSIASRISNELRTEYLVGYLPSNTERDGKYRHVKVQVNAKDQAKLDTYYRRGYYAPVQ